ncbi:MAG: endonuclease/exonuclease/phosphatase family protein [Gammaproteobacteria bacterium]
MLRWLESLLVTLAGVTTVLGLLPLGARLWWVFDLTTNFRLQYLGVAAALLALLALRRKWLPAAALSVIAALNAWPVLPYVPHLTPTTVAPPTAAHLKVLAVNVSNRQFSARRFRKIVAQAAPDVLLVVEFSPRAEEVLAEFDRVFPQQLKAPAEGPYGIGLWSRFPLQSAFTFPLGPVQALEARVETPAGAFTLLGAHLVSPTLPRRAEQRNEGLKLLAQRRAEVSGPVIVAGDFNVTPYSPYYIDWLATTGLTDSRNGRTLSASWPAILPILGIPIDHVAVSNEFVILGHDRLPAFGSDHWGIMAELALQPPATPSGASP